MSIDYNELDELVKKAHAIKAQIDDIDIITMPAMDAIKHLGILKRELDAVKSDIMKVLGL